MLRGHCHPVQQQGALSEGLMWWVLAWEVLHTCGTIISWEHPWEVTPHLCFYGDPEQEEQPLLVKL